MSNIYIQEPPTNGKVVLRTTVGDIEIELWSKEAPKACRNFVQLCMEGYYEKTIFHRLVKDFIVQGGDPMGTGEGGESIYGHPFSDEFHSRLRFVRRGLVAMANAGPHDNGSQFFFTLASTPELQNKHTIFGKVVGDTIYNMVKLAECGAGRDERPNVIHNISKTLVLSNPFDDIVPRKLHKTKESSEKKKKSQAKATKDFKLLSFGDEAEEDEDETFKLSQSSHYKIKSSHEVLDDPALSSVPVPIGEDADKLIVKDQEESSALDIVRKKLAKDGNGDDNQPREETKLSKDGKNLEDLKKEARRIKKELKQYDKEKGQEAKKMQEEHDAEPKDGVKSAYAEFKAEKERYKKQTQLKTGKDREKDTAELLASFQSKLSQAKTFNSYNFGGADVEESNEEEGEVNAEDEIPEFDNDLLNHMFTAEDKGSKVLDANIYDANRYDLIDPRNPMTKRRREESKNSSKIKKVKSDDL